MRNRLLSIFDALRGVRRSEGLSRWGSLTLRFVPQALNLTTEQAISVAAAYGCLRAIVDPLAASDWEVFTREGSRRTNLVDGTAYYALNLRANRNLPAVAAKELLVTAAVLHGDGYALILRDGSGRFIGWDPLDSSRMTKRWLRDEKSIGGGFIVYEYLQEDGSAVFIPDTDIIHLRGPSVRNLFGGDSLVTRAMSAIATAAAQEKFGQHYFAAGAHLGGYIKMPGRLRTDEDVKRLKADWESKYAGIAHAGSTAVLEGGAEYHPLTPDAEKIQLVAPRAFSVEDIARYFGVPLVKLMVKEAATGYGSNLSTLNEQFSRDTLTPWATRASQEVGYKVLPQRAPWPQIAVNLGWLTRGDAESRARVRKMDVEGGVITRDEARAEEGLSALPGGVGAVPTTLGSVTALTKDSLAPKPPPPPPELPSAPKAPEQPEEPEDPEEGEDDAAVARVAVMLDRHARRMEARRRDLERNAPGKVEENLAAERGRFAAELAAVICSGGGDKGADLNMQVETVAAAVLAGEPAHLAAARLLAEMR